MDNSNARPLGTAASPLLEGFITPEALATELGVSLRTLARWQAQRKGPARCVVGKLILYRVDAVRDWLAKLERGTVAPGLRRRR